jgi:hypothetical protein
LFQIQGRTPVEKYKTLETIYRKGSMSYMSLNGLKDSEWDVKTLKIIHKWVVVNCPKSGNSCKSLWTDGKKTSNDTKINKGTSAH